MKTYILRLHLNSDATFGRGDGVPGLVDAEVEHDQYGLPFLRGRTLKGLLVEECANILYALKQQGRAADNDDVWHKAAKFLFGQPGSTPSDDGEMYVGDARLPEELRQAVTYEIDERKTLRSIDVLESLTSIRRQTAMTVHGAPETGSLCAMRVLLRKTVFESVLSFNVDPAGKPELGLLAACIVSLRRVGTGRNRGRGCVTALLAEHADADEATAQAFTAKCLASFAKEIG